MVDILKHITDAERLSFSQKFPIQRDYLGDRLFPDQKTENLMAEYLRIANGSTLPVMATVHAFDTEAEIASRPVFERISVEKLFIKRKINQTERIRLLLNSGVRDDWDAIKGYVYDDMGLMSESVKTRTEVAKMEVLSTGKMAIDENNVALTVDYGVPAENTAFELDLSADADIIGQIQTIVDYAKDNGYTINEVVTSNTVLRKLAANAGIQTAIYGSVGVGAYVPTSRIQTFFADVFGITAITANDERYKYEKADGTQTTARYFPEDKISFIATGITNTFGVGLWGTTPEELEYGAFTEKSANQFITISQWATPDPVAVWTKASGVFIPVLPDPSALFIATDTSVSG